MQVEKISIDQLIYDPNNARKHPEKNIMAIKGSLAKFGQQKPIVIDHSNIIIAGNGTVEAAKQLGWTEIDIVRSDLSGFNATAFALADNRTAELAEWDDEIRDNLLKGLDAVEFDLPSIGFDAIPQFVPDLPDDDEEMKLKENKLLIVIQCENDQQQQELFIELNERGFKVKV